MSVWRLQTRGGCILQKSLIQALKVLESKKFCELVAPSSNFINSLVRSENFVCATELTHQYNLAPIELSLKSKVADNLRIYSATNRSCLGAQTQGQNPYTMGIKPIHP